jgi:long-chain acyl-CoA synthetase
MEMDEEGHVTMYLGEHARTMPSKPALIDVAMGTVVTFKQLDDRSNQMAQFLHGIGLRRGDHVAIMLENRPELLEIAWATMRSGLYLTTVNRYLTAEEAGHIIDDSDAQVLITSAAQGEVAAHLRTRLPRCRTFLMMDGPADGWSSYEQSREGAPARRLEEEWLGETMLYSSGTTGRPKGIKRSLVDAKIFETFRTNDTIEEYRFDENTVYLSPAPLYHAAPLSYAMGVQHRGGTVIMMRKFDAAEALALIERYRITHSQWVPTMFVRLLKLPPEERAAYDVSSLRYAVHAAAPCPPEVKRAMIDWWGPVVYEYYAGTESNGITRIDSAEWLEHPGSVGRARTGVLHICADDGTELPPGQSGLIYFERDVMPFAYHKDPAKTDAARHPEHPNWSTLGDVGYVDEEGYLYLTDRKAFMIISGGVNIYPREIEDALISHPKVRDVAVFGIPSAEMGEDVKAVVEVADGVEPGDDLARELKEFVAGRVARYMVPRSIDFIEEMPRLPTGKLYKAALRERYWPKVRKAPA